MIYYQIRKDVNFLLNKKSLNNKSQPVFELQPADELANAILTPISRNCLIESSLNGVIAQTAMFSTPLQGFPTDGSQFIVLSSGIANNAPGKATDFANTSTGGPIIPGGEPMSSPDGLTSYDTITLSLKLNVPENPGSLSFDWKFGTEENPSFLNSSFQDYFRADVITSSGSFNIAKLPDLTPVTVNNTNNFSNSPTNTSENPQPPYPNPDDVDYNAITSEVITSTFNLSPYAGEIITLSFRVADSSDSTLDSAVFIDNLQIEGCNGSHHPLCEKLHMKQVICDEIIYFEHDEIEVPINYFEGVNIPNNSDITGDITITVEDCEVIQTVINDQEFLAVNLTFLTQKELEITTPSPENLNIPLEFVERIQGKGILRKIFPGDLDLLNVTLDQLRCKIIKLNATDFFILNDNNTFSEELTIEIKIKLLADVQKYFKLCSKEKMVDINVVEVED